MENLKVKLKLGNKLKNKKRSKAEEVEDTPTWFDNINKFTKEINKSTIAKREENQNIVVSRSGDVITNFVELSRKNIL